MIKADVGKAGDPLTIRIMEALVEADARRLHLVAVHLNQALVAMTGAGLAPPTQEDDPARPPH